jgi:hypothetical protein
MISEFIFSGNFIDPFEEFFIEKIYALNSNNKKFLFKLTSNPNKIPSFLGE